MRLDYIDNVDCLEGMKQIPDGKVDMILCDLPYGLTANKWDSPIPLDCLWEAYERVCKPNAVIALFASQPFAAKLVVSNERMFRHEWIWIKNRGSNFANTVREPMKEHEHVLIFSKGKWTYNKQMQPRAESGLKRVAYRFDNQTANSTNYRSFNKPNANQGALRVPSSWQKFNVEVGFHPTQKPVPLLEYIINTYSDSGDVILDNCIGSGSTAVACINTGRHYIGFETEKVYCEIAQRRINEAEEKHRTLFDYMALKGDS